MAQSPRYALSLRACLFAVLATLLTACTLQQTVVTAVESQADATAEPIPVTLYLWHSVSPRQAETLQAIANGWGRQQSPAVQMELRSMSGAESIHQALLAAIQTQQTPDLAFIRPADLYLYAEADALIPLDAYWDSLDGERQNDYLNSFLAATQCAVDDKTGLWAMPTHRYQTVLYVNTTQIKAQLNFSNPPATWEELANECNAHLAQTRQACLSLLPTSDMATLLFLSHDNSIVDPTTYQTTLTDGSALTALQQIAALRDRQVIQNALSYDGATFDFVAGRTLFAVDRTAPLAQYAAAIGDKFEWEVVPFPTEGTPPRTLATGGNLAVFHTTLDREALALSFLDYLTDTEVNARWAEAMDAFPIRHSSLEWLTTKNPDPHFQQAADLLPSAHSLPCIPQWHRIESQITQLVADTLNQVAPPEELLAGAVENTNNLLR